jgi:hypothetical protein
MPSRLKFPVFLFGMSINRSGVHSSDRLKIYTLKFQVSDVTIVPCFPVFRPNHKPGICVSPCLSCSPSRRSQRKHLPNVNPLSLSTMRASVPPTHLCEDMFHMVDHVFLTCLGLILTVLYETMNQPPFTDLWMFRTLCRLVPDACFSVLS